MPIDSSGNSALQTHLSANFLASLWSVLKFFMGIATASGQFTLQTTPEGRGIPYSSLLAKKCDNPLAGSNVVLLRDMFVSGMVGEHAETPLHKQTHTCRHPHLRAHTRRQTQEHTHTMLPKNPWLRAQTHVYRCIHLYREKICLPLLTHVFETCTKRCDQDTYDHIPACVCVS